MTARTRSIRELIVSASMLVAFMAPTMLLAQDSRIPPVMDYADLSGPRFGVTVLPQSLVDTLNARGMSVGPLITQFGWQFERIFYRSETGFSAMAEWILLVGGLDQGAFLPSLSWMFGIRTRRGIEFGVGPNVSTGGFGLALATGITTRAGPLNVPINLAVVPSDLGTRVSVLVGFTMQTIGSNWW
jgi:hypothetical protein